jgi:hypothetical protein
LFSDANVAGVEGSRQALTGRHPPPGMGLKKKKGLKITPNFSFAKFTRVGERERERWLVITSTYNNISLLVSK